MTSSPSSGRSRIDRAVAETRFANQMSADAVRDALARSADRDGHLGIDASWKSFRAMHQLATGAFSGDAQQALKRISTDFNARRQFRDILAACATARQEQQAAAASFDSGTAATRPGQMFDLTMSPSSRNDGVLYLQVKFHPDSEAGKPHGGHTEETASATMLFADTNGEFSLLRLPEIVDGTAQIMLDISHEMVRAFRDPETEFFIR